jgi:sigma-B regulation protein RsbU (phosphoserine phosphatase)
MAAVVDAALRDQLIDRRQKLEAVIINDRDESRQLAYLLEEVDAALARMQKGSYGLCDVCHDPIEAERLMANPVVAVCLGCLTPAQTRALEEDLQLAAQIQAELLPSRELLIDGWDVSFHYEAASLVSGDYCDLLVSDDKNIYFMIGDVSGKGVAASLLMSQLHAMFRTLIPLGLPINRIVERASRVFCESTLSTHYATLVVGRAERSGQVEICNAGHLPPLLAREGRVTYIGATGLPIGVFCNEEFTSETFQMNRGDTLFMYTDGLSEARDRQGAEYGAARLSEFLCLEHERIPGALVTACIEDLAVFSGGSSRSDDLTVMALRRAH